MLGPVNHEVQMANYKCLFTGKSGEAGTDGCREVVQQRGQAPKWMVISWA